MIRTMTPADRALFYEMSEEFYASPAVSHDIPGENHARAFDEVLRGELLLGLMLLDGDTPAGFALLAKSYSREAGGKVLWLEELFVLPAYRSCGLGREFFAAAEQYARENGFARIRLEVEEDNVRARSLYERLGYEDLEYRQMVKQLRPSGAEGEEA